MIDDLMALPVSDVAHQAGNPQAGTRLAEGNAAAGAEEVDQHPLLLAALTFDARVLGDYVRRQDPSISRQRLVFGEEFVRRMQAANLMRADLEPGVTAYIMTVISFGLLGIRQYAPDIPAPSFERLAVALADLVDRGLATHANDDDSEAGKQAFRNLTDETTRLYTERAEAAGGSHDRPRSQT